MLSIYVAVGAYSGFYVEHDSPATRLHLGFIRVCWMSCDLDKLLKDTLNTLRKRDLELKCVARMEDRLLKQLDEIDQCQSVISSLEDITDNLEDDKCDLESTVSDMRAALAYIESFTTYERS